MDPKPYLMAAYGVGALLLGSFALWNRLQRRRWRQLEALVSAESNPDNAGMKGVGL